jgi:DNA-directed RNA polymerase subunit RPC12/RpoP
MRDPSADTVESDKEVECPYCGSTDTERDHPKGPSLCRSLYLCRECGEPFEQFG